MITRKLFFIPLILIAVFAMTSCGTSKRAGKGKIFQKRQFNKGFYFRKRVVAQPATLPANETVITAQLPEKTASPSKAILHRQKKYYKQQRKKDKFIARDRPKAISFGTNIYTKKAQKHSPVSPKNKTTVATKLKKKSYGTFKKRIIRSN
jgi:hypothetical protein